MTIDLERVSPRNRKILFHSSHGIPGISNRKILSNGKRPWSVSSIVHNFVPRVLSRSWGREGEDPGNEVGSCSLG